jgi:hypothetical protein
LADFWGNLGHITPTGRSSRVFQSPKNPDWTGLKPTGGPPLQSMVRQRSRVRLPTSALFCTASSPAVRYTICPRLSGRRVPQIPTPGVKNVALYLAIGRSWGPSMVRQGSGVRVPPSALILPWSEAGASRRHGLRVLTMARPRSARATVRQGRSAHLLYDLTRQRGRLPQTAVGLVEPVRLSGPGATLPR